MNIILEDTTLRDGEQAPGVSFNRQAKIEIYNALITSGVKWLEVGIPAMGGEELETIKYLKDMAAEQKVNAIAWNRGVEEDVRFSINLGFKYLHIGLPTSNVHLSDSLNKTRGWLLNKATDLIKMAKDKDIFVSISAEDVGRTEISFLQEYAIAVEAAGADRLRLSDTIGILNPISYTNIIKSIKQVSKIDLQSHAHNDFGLAVANTLAAIESGVKYFHVTVNGMGERAGMPDLAQVVMSLKQFYGVDLGITLSELTRLGGIVAKHSNTKLYPWQPIVGENVFAHESGIHASATIKNDSTFEPFSPDMVGGQRKIVIGKHSGKNAIKYVLEQDNCNVSDNLLPQCLDRVRSFSMDIGRALTNAELKNIYESCLA